MDQAYEGLMAGHTIALDYLGVERMDAYRFYEIPNRKGRAVIPPVQPFDQPFFDKSLRGMAIVAGGHRPVA